MTKMVMNGIAFGACIAGIAAIDIAEKRAIRKLQKENDKFWSNINRPEDRWVKVKVRDVK